MLDRFADANEGRFPAFAKARRRRQLRPLMEQFGRKPSCQSNCIAASGFDCGDEMKMMRVRIVRADVGFRGPRYGEKTG